MVQSGVTATLKDSRKQDYLLSKHTLSNIAGIAGVNGEG